MSTLDLQAVSVSFAARGGGSTQALSELLTAVAATSTDPDVVRYRRALTAYAADLGDGGRRRR